MKKLTEKQKMKRAEDIETALYAVERTLQADRLRNIVYSYGPGTARQRKLTALVRAMANRTADLLLKAFGNEVHGKKYWPPKKEKKR